MMFDVIKIGSMHFAQYGPKTEAVELLLFQFLTIHYVIQVQAW